MARIAIDPVNVILSKGDNHMSLGKFLETINGFRTETYKKTFKEHTGLYETLSAEIGTKYIRIVSRKEGDKYGSCYCFLDFQGNIYKSASWKIPAKHIRGSVFDENCSWEKSLGPYGAAYLR